MRDRKVINQDSESRFFEALKDVFIGAEVEGESGYINLIRIKSKYFNKILKLLQKEIDEKTKEFPEFKKELFDKLYSFFKRYFSESGSIYFRHTPFNERIYERVYTDNENVDEILKLLQKEIDETKEFPEFKKELFDKLYSFFKRYFRRVPFNERIFERVYTDNKDVVMFWKTHMLYYVKTDILPKNMRVTIDGVRFFFDVSKLQHKKAWEKRELIYELKEIGKDGTIVFNVLYSERGKKTKVNEILKELKKKGINLDEEVLEKAFRVFEKQNEVDYFINKNARQFLKEQFDLWLYQYVFADETRFTEKRIKQLKVLKEIAYKIIDFIAQFEDELVKIWQKPKFVLNSNYVITLNRIAKKEGGIKVLENIIEKLLEQKKEFERDLNKWKEIKSRNKTYRERFEAAGEIRNQIVEWFLLDLIDEGFDPRKILTNGILGKTLNLKYQFLPIDTKYFKDLELEILSLFDNLDKELDGRLIKSENWQALNSILPKFKEKVQLIYIDPPFNTGSNEFTMYINRFLDSAWITMMENRLRLAKEFLKDTGSIYVRIDYHGDHYVRFLMDDIFGKKNFRNEIIVNRTQEFFKYASGLTKFMVDVDSLLFYGKSDKILFNEIKLKRKIDRWWEPFLPGTPKNEQDAYRRVLGKLIKCPKGRKWGLTQEQIEELEKHGRIKIENGKVKYAPLWTTLKNNWTDIPGYSRRWCFQTENSEQLLQRVIQASSNPGDIVMDFFLGSGTTTAVAHKLGRKWIGIEMGDLSARDKNKDFFYTITLVRMKKVLAGEQSGISKKIGWKGGGFFKYYELEQYEDTLRRVKYADTDPFFDPTQDPYNQYVFMKDPKLLEALEIDYENNKVKVNLEKLYKNIDIAETFSNLLGKWIKRITEEYVEFEDGEKVNIKDLDFKLIKPLIWW